MGLYRDSQLGLCLDITGPDGNVFVILGIADDLAKQLGKKEEWDTAIEAMKIMAPDYITVLNLFREYFPIVTLVGYDEYINHSQEDQDNGDN